jgi:hypothetical protein
MVSRNIIPQPNRGNNPPQKQNSQRRMSQNRNKGRYGTILENWRRWHENEVECLAENRGLAVLVSTLKIEQSPTSGSIFVKDILPTRGLSQLCINQAHH